MGIRQTAYWVRQAEAIDRQHVALFAHAVAIGMAGDKEDRQRALDNLELTKTAKESREERSRATWDLMQVFGGGLSV